MCQSPFHLRPALHAGVQRLIKKMRPGGERVSATVGTPGIDHLALELVCIGIMARLQRGLLLGSGLPLHPAVAEWPLPPGGYDALLAI